MRRIVNDYHDGRLAIVAIVIVPVIGWSIASSITESAVAVTQPVTITKSTIAQPATITVASRSESPVAAQSQPTVAQPTNEAETTAVAIEAATVAESARKVIPTTTVVDGAGVAIAGDDYRKAVDVGIAVGLPSGRDTGCSGWVGANCTDGSRGALMGLDRSWGALMGLDGSWGALIRPKICSIDAGKWANSTAMTSPSVPTAAATVPSTAPMTASMSAAVSTMTKNNRIPKADQEKTCQPA